MNATNAVYSIPLQEAPKVSFYYYQFSPIDCDSAVSTYATISIYPNGGHYYTAVYYDGTGLHTDTTHLTINSSNSINVFKRVYPAGTFQPVIRVWDDSTGLSIASYYAPSITFTDTCGNMGGMLYADRDGDCNYSANDRPLAGQPVTVLENGAPRIVLTDGGGKFYVRPQAGSNYSVDPADTLGKLYAACGNGAVSALTDSTSVNVPYQYVGNDVSILASHHYFKPAAADTLILYPSGTIANVDSGRLELTLPSDLTYTGANIPGGVQMGAQIVWTLDSLQKLPPVILIGLKVVLTPGASTLCLSAKLSGHAPDVNLTNNDFYLCDSVRASTPEIYKSVSSDSMSANGALLTGKELVYSIRVRNTDTTALQSLLVYDTLDARLDLSTLHILDADFDYNASLLPGRVLRVFNTTPLAIAPSTEVAIHFGIGITPDTATVFTVPNKATAVLNGLPAPASNTTSCGMLAPSVSVPHVIPIAAEQVHVYPVPASNREGFHIIVNSATAIGRYEIVNAQGGVCSQGALTGRLTSVRGSDLVPGIYVVRIITAGQTFSRKLVLIDSKW
jgi:hypothetical protein